MPTGVVRFYNDSKGFGLITPDLGGPALFAQQSAVRGGKKLRATQRVQFDLAEGQGEPAAVNIQVLP